MNWKKRTSILSQNIISIFNYVSLSIKFGCSAMSNCKLMISPFFFAFSQICFRLLMRLVPIACRIFALARALASFLLLSVTYFWLSAEKHETVGSSKPSLFVGISDKFGSVSVECNDSVWVFPAEESTSLSTSSLSLFLLLVSLPLLHWHVFFLDKFSMVFKFTLNQLLELVLAYKLKVFCIN